MGEFTLVSGYLSLFPSLFHFYFIISLVVECMSLGTGSSSVGAWGRGFPLVMSLLFFSFFFFPNQPSFFNRGHYRGYFTAWGI